MSTMPQTTRRVKSRRPLQPATGSCRWVVQPGSGPCPHPGVLVITSKRARGETVSDTYAVTENRDGGKLLGYRLTKPDGTVYDLPADLSACDCPDYTINRAHAQTPELRACKHCKALRKALAELES
jgi:hypothetical protein